MRGDHDPPRRGRSGPPADRPEPLPLPLPLPAGPGAGRDLPLIGRHEWVDLPVCRLRGIRAKIDTGARSSALHAVDFSFDHPDQPTRVTFTTGTWRRGGLTPVRLTRCLSGLRTVRNPGRVQLRPMVVLTLRLGRYQFATPVTLTDRREMTCPMLLGRRALTGRFLVDCSREDLLGPRPALPYRAGPAPADGLEI